MQKIDTILFDLDGTLIDSNHLIVKTFEETMKRFVPERTFTHQELVDMVGPPLKETFANVTGSTEKVPEMISFYRRYYIENEFNNIDIYPNTKDTLKTLHDRGFKLGVVTTKFKESAMPSILHYGLDKYLSSYCFLDDIRDHKPHPEPIFYALKQLPSYASVVMVGDNVSDILAGRNASTLTCGVEWSMKKDKIKALNPDFWISDFKELIQLIDAYNKEVE